MKISKVNTFNTNKQTILSFQNGTVSSAQQENEKHNKNSKNFLNGALIVSAGILAVAIAAKHGVFAKKTSKVAEELSDKKVDLDVLKNNSIVKNKKTEEILTGVPVNATKQHEINPLAFETNIDYTKFDIEADKTQQHKFFKNFADSLYRMSYEDQFDEFKYLINYLDKQDTSKIKTSININYGNLKRDNRNRFIQSFKELTQDKPEIQKIFQITDGEKAANFTNIFNNICKSNGNTLDDAFGDYLSFLKMFSPEELTNKVLFTPGRFPLEENVKMVKKAIQFAIDNPDYNDVIVRNLIRYETPNDFASSLANKNFHPGDDHKRYDKHVENIIEIRNLLTSAGLKCDEKGRIINRKDWLNNGVDLVNQFTLGFQHSHNIANIKKSAFEYDMMNGLTREEADEMIEILTSRNDISPEFDAKIVYGMPLEEMTAKINAAVV